MNKKIIPLAAVFLAGCASVPKGPDVAVMPGPGKSFEQFTADDRVCRDYSDKSLKTSVNKEGAKTVGEGAGVGVLLGAAVGALLGRGHPGAVESGAGVGLLMGSAVGAQNAGPAERDAQQRYDIAFEQCMMAKGNQLPVSTPPITYYRHRYYRQRVVIYQAPPTVIYQQGPPPADSMPPGPPN
jgi:hypothetical protein